MRIAAGIIMIILGMVILLFSSSSLVHVHPDVRDALPTLSISVLSAFIVAGGSFCVKRRYWKVCFASALFLFCIHIYALAVEGWQAFLSDTLYFPVGILPLVFVILRKRDWEKSQT